MAVTFHKMHGAGNDFVLLDLREQSYDLDAARAVEIADRRTGVGFDQLLVLRKPQTNGQLADFEVWNADGSRAEQCGNGVRCIGHYLHMCGETPSDFFSLGGPVAEFRVRCLDKGQVMVDMGAPDFTPENIPIKLEPMGDTYSLTVADEDLVVGAVSMGNPHAVVEVRDLDRTPVETLGPALSRHPAFPQGCNAGFAQVIDFDTIRLRVVERGVGETLACGSGACAAAAFLLRAGKTGKKVSVIQSGGRLIIEWHGGREPVLMTGPAVHVFEGMLS